jgi:hypothetical protein
MYLYLQDVVGRGDHAAPARDACAGQRVGPADHLLALHLVRQRAHRRVRHAHRAHELLHIFTPLHSPLLDDRTHVRVHINPYKRILEFYDLMKPP